MLSDVMSFSDLAVSLTAKDVARVLGISERTAWGVVHSDGFPKIKLGRRVIIPKQDFINWMNKQVAEGAAQDDFEKAE